MRGKGKSNPNRVAFVVFIFHLRLCQCGFFHGRPHHGLTTLIQRAVHNEFDEFGGDSRLRVGCHSQIGVIPLATNAQPLEFGGLDINPFLGETAAFLAEFYDGDFVFVLAFIAVFFFDFPFNRQAVAIPTRNITAVIAQHLLASVDEIL